jgi:pullulanase/glycogen debranching enzyme
MKRASLVFSLLPLVLASCGSTDPLPKGDGTYAIDETVSNEGGSLSYEIFVRSFYDADGDGIGDFDGILAKADYLKQLGVGNIWLLPVFRSPSYHGYDT